MQNYGLLRAVGEQGPPSPERRPEVFDQWYRFLGDECRKENGLLCFYDRHKSREVAYFCGLLADCLTGAGEANTCEGPEGFVDLGTLPGQRERFFAP